MTTGILTLLPELEMFSDRELKEKTSEIWEKAIDQGEWRLEDLLEMPFTLLIEKTPVNIITHTRAVTRTALKIADVLVEEYQDRVNIDRDHLLSGALLHDVGKLFEYRKQDGKFVKSEEGKLLRHPVSGALFAGRFDLPKEILHIIAAHSKEGDGARKTVEAVIVNHADFVNFESLKI